MSSQHLSILVRMRFSHSQDSWLLASKKTLLKVLLNYLYFARFDSILWSHTFYRVWVCGSIGIAHCSKAINDDAF